MDMHMHIACMYVCDQMHVECPQWSEESTESPGTGVISGCEPNEKPQEGQVTCSNHKLQSKTGYT